MTSSTIMCLCNRYGQLPDEHPVEADALHLPGRRLRFTSDCQVCLAVGK